MLGRQLPEVTAAERTALLDRVRSGRVLSEDVFGFVQALILRLVGQAPVAAPGIRTGMYQSASEVIRAGLRLLKEEKSPKPGFVVSSAEELEEKLFVSIRQLREGEGIPGDVAAKQLRERAKARRKRNA